MIFAHIYPRLTYQPAKQELESFERALFNLGASAEDRPIRDSNGNVCYSLSVIGIDSNTAVDLFFKMHDRGCFPFSRWFLFPEQYSTADRESVICCEICHEPVGRSICVTCATLDGGTGE